MAVLDFYWKNIQEELKIENGIEDQYLGLIRVRDMEGMVDKIMEKWVNQFRVIPELLQNDKALHLRFFTRKELNDIFDIRLGEYVQSLKDNGAELGARAIERTGRLLLRQKKQDSYREIMDGHAKLIDATVKFCKAHMAYAVLGIDNEKKREDFARLFLDKNRYFYAMQAVNPTLSNFFSKQRKFYIPDEARRRHTYIVAASGQGKSELLKSFIRFDILRNKSSVIVLDPKGDFAKQIAKFKEFTNPYFAKRLMYIDPFLDYDYSPIWNPFSTRLKFDEKPEDLAIGISDLLFQIFKDQDVAVSASMKLLLMNMVYVLCLRPGSTLIDLDNFLYEERNQYLLDYVLKFVPNKKIVNFFTKPKDKWDKREGFFLGHLKQSKDALKVKINRLLSSGRIQRITCGKSTFNIETAMNEKKIIIFNLSKGKLKPDTSTLYGRLLLNHILDNIMSRVHISPENRIPCNIYVDEFHDFSSDALQTAFEQARGFNARLTVATQGIGQGITTGQNESIFNSTYVKIVSGGSKKTRSGMASEMDLGVEEIANFTGLSEYNIKRLEVGEFILQIGNGMPFKAFNRLKTIDDKHSMTEEEWKLLKKDQLRKYYFKENADDLNQNKNDTNPRPHEPKNDSNKKKFGNNYDE